MTAEELLDRIYSEAEPMTSAETPVGVCDVGGYLLGVELMRVIEDYLHEYWDRLEQEEAASPASRGAADQIARRRAGG